MTTARLTTDSLARPTAYEMTAVLKDAIRQMKCAVIALDTLAADDAQAQILMRELNRSIGDAYRVLCAAGRLP